MTTEGFFHDSSDIFRESPCRGIGGNIAKKLKQYILWFFQSIFCFTFLCNFFDLYACTFTTFTNTTSKPSHHNHSIIPLSNHHTKILFVNFCECEWYKSKKLQRNVKQKISLTFKFFCNISPNTATRGFPEDLWRLEKNVFIRDLVCLRVSLCIPRRPWRAEVLFFILLYQRNIQY